MSSMLAASMRKSSSSTIVSANSSTRAGGLASDGDRDAADEVWREPRHDAQVVAHETIDGRPLHLDDDVFAGAQPCRVDLGDRRGRERCAVERLEHVLEA